MAEVTAAEVNLKNAMKELFGDEKTIIVQNLTKGVVPIGFGKNGMDGGAEITRSTLPIDLGTIAPPDRWLESPDFRKALSKHWLRLVSREEFDYALQVNQEHEARLEALASGDVPVVKKFDAQINPLQERQINPETSQLEPTENPDLAARVSQYERNLNSAPPTVLKDGRSARAEALVDATRRASIAPIDAIRQLDQDAPLYDETDLAHVAEKAEYPGLRNFATKLLHDRRNKE